MLARMRIVGSLRCSAGYHVAVRREAGGSGNASNARAREVSFHGVSNYIATLCIFLRCSVEEPLLPRYWPPLVNPLSASYSCCTTVQLRTIFRCVCIRARTTCTHEYRNVSTSAVHCTSSPTLTLDVRVNSKREQGLKTLTVKRYY